MVKYTLFIVEDVIHDRTCYYPADEVWQEHKGLRNLLKYLAEYFIQQDCTAHFKYNSQEQKCDIIQKRISCYLT